MLKEPPYNKLDTAHASDTLREVEPRVQRKLVSSLSFERTSELINEMTPAQAADVLAVLPASRTDAILLKVRAPDAVKIRALIDKHDDHVVDLASARYISFPPETTVDELMGKYRDVAWDADVVMYVCATAPDNVLLGVVDIKDLLKAGAAETLGHIMKTNIISLDESDTVAVAFRLFSRHGFRALPVFGKGNILKGVVPYRDIMQLTHRFV